MEKVQEPNIGETWECPRCLNSHCDSCVEQHTVDFEVEDKKEGNPNIGKIQWKGLIVCPWCYNQLIDLKGE